MASEAARTAARDLFRRRANEKCVSQGETKISSRTYNTMYRRQVDSPKDSSPIPTILSQVALVTCATLYNLYRTLSLSRSPAIIYARSVLTRSSRRENKFMRAVKANDQSRVIVVDKIISRRARVDIIESYYYWNRIDLTGYETIISDVKIAPRRENNLVSWISRTEIFLSKCRMSQSGHLDPKGLFTYFTYFYNWISRSESPMNIFVRN